MLQPTLATPASMKGITKGLMGNNDGNAENDLIDPDGNVLPKNSTEQQIYENFGVKCEY